MEPYWTTTKPEIWFRTLCRKNGLEVSGDALLQLSGFVNHLLEWNRKVNLVSRRDAENVWQSHILHAVSPLFKLTFDEGLQILDLGCGGGLPGIPLSILNPTCSFVLLDATQKKVKAVQDIVERLQLQNVKTVWGRAEDVGTRTGVAGTFDVVIARAVAPLKDLVQWSRPFLSLSGTGQRYTIKTNNASANLSHPCLLAFKGGDVEAEINAIVASEELKDVRSIDLTFHGSEQIPLIDKKLVIVTFKRKPR